MSRQILTLLSGVTATGVGAFQSVATAQVTNRGFQATVIGTGAVSATVLVEASNDNVNFFPLLTFNLNGTGSATNGIINSAPYAYLRGNVTALTGTGAAVTLNMAS